MDTDASSSTSPASTLRLSPFTPSLTASPTIATSSSPLLHPKYDFGDYTWPASQQCELDHNTIILGDARPRKKRPKLDNEPIEHHVPPPPVVSIPPAQASDLPRDLHRKGPRKRSTTTVVATATTTSRSKPHVTSTRPKSLPVPSKRKPPPETQPMRFRFVSVHHSPDNAPDLPAAFEEHMEDDEESEDGPFEHSPSEFPPRAYPGGEYAVSPLLPSTKPGKIPASSLDFLPVLEARFTRLENAIEHYIALRAKKALSNSILPDAWTPVPPHRRPHQ